MWKFNHFFSCDGMDNAEGVKPVYDGKNLWVMQNDGTAKCVEFWGPYADDADLPNNIYTRNNWPISKTNLRTYQNLGPATRVIKSFDFGGVGQLAIYNDRLYWSDGNKMKRVLLTAATDTVVEDWVELANEGNSEIVIVNDRVYYVGVHPTTQNTVDSQKLYWVSTVTGAITEGAILPGRKQTTLRSMVMANDILYISSYNTREVHKFNALTGAYLTSIIINRDVAALYRSENDVYVISSLRGKAVVGDTEYASSMVSRLTAADAVEHEFGILTGGNYMADDGTNVWFQTDTKRFIRTRKSDKLSFIHKDINIEGAGPDYQVDPVDPAGNTVDDVINLIFTPSFGYTSWNFEQDGPYDYFFPAAIHFISSNAVHTLTLPSPLRWENDITLNQYTAVSTGGSGYKQD